MEQTRDLTLKPYDVIQIAREGKWVDFCTLRTEGDFAAARRLVEEGQWEGKPVAFRVVCLSWPNRGLIKLGPDAGWVTDEYRGS
jgi:hypothetical protein